MIAILFCKRNIITSMGFWNIKKCWMTVAGQKLQVQEWRFRIVRPTGNPDEPLRFRHASPQGEEPPCVRPTRVNPFVPENLT